jgi:uncharacterized protein YbjT (DUF2867 family)
VGCDHQAGRKVKNMRDRIVLITGVTGKQGGAVARALAGKGFKLRGTTRKPDGEPARAARALGVEIVRADFDDAASLEAAMTGAWGIFAMQNTWEAGVRREEEQGLRMAMLARTKGIEHYVYTSVQSANRRTGIPHFDNKARVEAEVRRLQFPSHAILRPVFFMENLTSPWFLSGDELVSGLEPATVLQMIAVEDVGRVGARLFTDAEAMNGREIDIAGDALTLPRAAETLGRATGKTLRYRQIPIAEIRKNSDDYATMLEWFDAVGYNANIPALDREFGRMTRLEEWAGRTVHV